MRVTYGIYLDLQLGKALPDFFESQPPSESRSSLDQANFRLRKELGRIEVEGVTAENRGAVRQLVERAGGRLMLQEVAARFRNDLFSLGDFDAVANECQVTVVEVENVPNPSWTHGMEGADVSVRCPNCDKPMVRRQGSRGPFWGCQDYPGCSGTRRISA